MMQKPTDCREFGEVAEWFKAAVLKTTAENIAAPQKTAKAAQTRHAISVFRVRSRGTSRHGGWHSMRLLVCGGRRFDNVPWLWALLDGIDSRDKERGGEGVRCLIDGAQKAVRNDGGMIGADYWANQWALARSVPTERYPADWIGHGRSAGPKRNQRMVDEGKPTHGLAMPGGNGTADMVSRMQKAGITVYAPAPVLSGSAL